MNFPKQIDLRSDTVTQPTPEMLQAMMTAEVGDDVFGEDPTVNKLEQKAAALFGMEAALFCPSGTMTNQIGIKILTSPLCEVICDRASHIYNYEGGGMAFTSAVSIRTVNGDRGRLKAQDVLDNINPDDVHFPVTRLVAIENTCNKGGGSCYDFSEIKKIHKVCRENNLLLHLDGARLFNALAESRQIPKDYGKLFDTISICLSKGLGAPAGSVLISNHENIKKARRVRKVLGGGMRQAGYLAAAGIYALDHHVKRLKDDHQRAKVLEKALRSAAFTDDVLPAETNIVIFRLNEKYDDAEFISTLKEKGILAVQMDKKLMRFVTHLDFNDAMLERVVKVLKKM
ncbi:MAG TPA: GntG family PLP-dependent aldolase [Chitinophagales bacterium]|nr:GntG family PLP-dependent aldolase [Chitinophagales bacterium]